MRTKNDLMIKIIEDEVSQGIFRPKSRNDMKCIFKELELKYFGTKGRK